MWSSSPADITILISGLDLVPQTVWKRAPHLYGSLRQDYTEFLEREQDAVYCMQSGGAAFKCGHLKQV